MGINYAKVALYKYERTIYHKCPDCETLNRIDYVLRRDILKFTIRQKCKGCINMCEVYVNVTLVQDNEPNAVEVL